MKIGPNFKECESESKCSVLHFHRLVVVFRFVFGLTHCPATILFRDRRQCEPFFYILLDSHSLLPNFFEVHVFSESDLLVPTAIILE